MPCCFRVASGLVQLLGSAVVLCTCDVVAGVCENAADAGKTVVVEKTFGTATLKVLCGEDAAAAAARAATDRRTATADASSVIQNAQILEEALAAEAPGYKPPDVLDKGIPEAERPRLLKTAGAYSRRAMGHSRDAEFKLAIADLLRALVRPGLDPTAGIKLKSILGDFLNKAKKKREEQAADGDMSFLFDALELEDDGKDLGEVDAKVLKTVYRKLSVKYHPDKSPAAAERFNEIRDAYEILSDPVKVLLYDTGGTELVKKFEGGKSDLERTDNKEHEVHVTLKDLYMGKQQTIRTHRRIICRSCRLQPNLPRCKKCNRCPGEMQQRQRWLNQHQYTVDEIEIPSKEKCTNHNSELTVNIERGMLNGDRIHHPFKADQLPKQIPGDVLVTVRMEKHPHFKRVADDLVITIRVTLYEALMGFERELVHLDGHIVKFSVNRGDVLKPGAGLEILNEGMPIREDPSSFGRLLVQFEIEFPKEMPAEAANNFENAFRSLGQGAGETRIRGRAFKTEL